MKQVLEDFGDDHDLKTRLLTGRRVDLAEELSKSLTFFSPVCIFFKSEVKLRCTVETATLQTFIDIYPFTKTKAPKSLSKRNLIKLPSSVATPYGMLVTNHLGVY